MRHHAVALCVGAAVALGSCSPPNRVFSPVPFPALSSMTCTLEPVGHGVLNPAYHRDRSNGGLNLAFRDLDPDAGSATMQGNNGSSVVEYRPTDNQMQFIETTPMGSLTLTTVFAPPEIGEPMPVVHSRHIEVSPANVAISQYAGDCVSD